MLVDEPDRVEDLHRVVRVEAREDLGDRAEVAVDELAQPAVVVDRAVARAPGDEQLEVGDAEGVLDVHGEQADAPLVLGRRPNPVLCRPGRRLAGALLVGDSPYLADAARVEVCRQRQILHGGAESRRRYTRAPLSSGNTWAP